MPLFGFDPNVVPDIDFAQKDASIVQSQVVSDYERLFYLATRINKTLGRADPVRLFLLNIIYQLVVQRNIIDFTGKNNLIKYARGDYLDNIGARWGPTRGKRLSAQYASTTLRFSLSATLAIDVIVPYGIRVQTNSGVEFSTTTEGRIPSGDLSCDVPAIAITPGEIANNLAPGQITNLVSPSSQPFLTEVTNITVSGGGAERESDERYRARIWMAPESFSVAGPYKAYEYWAGTANSNITDVRVWSAPPIAGDVHIYFLTNHGLPTPEEIAQVYAVCNADDIRPLTDHLFVEAPIVYDFPIIATFWIDQKKAVFAEEVRVAVYRAFDDYKKWQSEEIGKAVNMSVMIQMLINAGACRVGLISPGLDDATNLMAHNQVAMPDGSQLSYGGLESRAE